MCDECESRKKYLLLVIEVTCQSIVEIKSKIYPGAAPWMSITGIGVRRSCCGAECCDARVMSICCLNGICRAACLSRESEKLAFVARKVRGACQYVYLSSGVRGVPSKLSRLRKMYVKIRTHWGQRAIYPVGTL